MSTGYGKTKKKICFASCDKAHADLKIRLHYDNIKIKEFFNEIVKGYLEKDKNMMDFIDKLKEKKHVPKTKTNKDKKMITKQKEVIRKFALDKKEIENIFDILEKEHSDL